MSSHASHMFRTGRASAPAPITPATISALSPPTSVAPVTTTRSGRVSEPTAKTLAAADLAPSQPSPSRNNTAVSVPAPDPTPAPARRSARARTGGTNNTHPSVSARNTRQQRLTIDDATAWGPIDRTYLHKEAAWAAAVACEDYLLWLPPPNADKQVLYVTRAGKKCFDDRYVMKSQVPGKGGKEEEEENGKGIKKEKVLTAGVAKEPAFADSTERFWRAVNEAIATLQKEEDKEDEEEDGEPVPSGSNDGNNNGRKHGGDSGLDDDAPAAKRCRVDHEDQEDDEDDDDLSVESGSNTASTSVYASNSVAVSRGSISQAAVTPETNMGIDLNSDGKSCLQESSREAKKQQDEQEDDREEDASGAQAPSGSWTSHHVRRADLEFDLDPEEYFDMKEDEETFHARPSIKLPMPDHLKAMLVDDWENVTKNQQLVPLPHPHPVNEILDDYLAFERPHRQEGSAAMDILEETVAGLREYFDKCLGRILLYRFERGQYHEMHALWQNPESKHKSPLDTYGAEHLSRLLVSLPELIAQTNMDQQSVNRLREELTKFTNWFARHVVKYFVSEYENPGQDYIEAARAN